MPIRTGKISSINLNSLKRAIEKLSRNAVNLQNPGGTDKLYVTSVPGAADLAEGQQVYYYDGTNYRVYIKLNGAIKTWTLT